MVIYSGYFRLNGQIKPILISEGRKAISPTRLGQAISLARRRRHLTQQDLAERSGTSANTVRRMEAGHPGAALVHFARALQVYRELDKLDQLLDTPRDTIGLILMNEKLPQRVRKPRKTPESGAF